MDDSAGLTRRELPVTSSRPFAGNTFRGVAQPGRAPGSGPGGRRFKSCLPDQISRRKYVRIPERESRSACALPILDLRCTTTSRVSADNIAFFTVSVAITRLVSSVRSSCRRCSTRCRARSVEARHGEPVFRQSGGSGDDARRDLILAGAQQRRGKLAEIQARSIESAPAENPPCAGEPARGRTEG